MHTSFYPAVATAVLALCTGCTAAAPSSSGSGQAQGSSQLVPSFAPAPAPTHRPHRSAGASSAVRASAAPRPAAATSARPSRTVDPTPPADRRAAGTAAASLRDPAGDVRGGLGSPPPYVDLTGADLTRSADGYLLRVTTAGALPRHQGSDGRTTNVAGFFDVDGDGTVDYEVWANLADDGWGTSYRYPDGASYGVGSGVTAHADGHTLAIRFPRDHVGGAATFRWAVGAEWGSYQQVGSGTTASDHAPDSGATVFPG